jgi:hypothetical protein
VQTLNPSPAQSFARRIVFDQTGDDSTRRMRSLLHHATTRAPMERRIKESRDKSGQSRAFHCPIEPNLTTSGIHRKQNVIQDQR